MEISELLSAKELTAARLVEIGVAVGVSGSGPGYHHLKLSIETTDFAFLTNDRRLQTTLRSLVSGHAARGLVICITENGGRTITQQSKATITTTSSCRDLNVTENKVPLVKINAVLAEYSDGSRYMLVGPLPAVFLSSAVREQLKRRAVQPMRAAALAFEAAGHALIGAEPEPAAAEETIADVLVPALTATHQPLVEGQSDPHPLVVKRPISTDELRAALALVNENAQQLRERGMTVSMRVEPDGVVRASVQVVFQEEL